MTKLTAKTKSDSYSLSFVTSITKANRKPSDLPGLARLAILFTISLDDREWSALGNGNEF